MIEQTIVHIRCDSCNHKEEIIVPRDTDVKKYVAYLGWEKRINGEDECYECSKARGWM